MDASYLEAVERGDMATAQRMVMEARNVSARINMTPEERRATLLSETEDVAREDQILLREGAEMAMARKKRGATRSNTSKLGQPTTANGNPPVAYLGTKLNKYYEIRRNND